MWRKVKTRFPAAQEMGLALALVAVGLWGAASGHSLIRQYLYFFAWYPYLLFLDGLLYHLEGGSRLFNRPRAAAAMFFWSTTVWLVFEAANLVLKNWAYVGLTADWGLRWGGYALAFATVLPGVLLTARVLMALGAFQGVRGRALTPGFAWQPAALLLGMAFLVLPLTFPRYAFPLMWGAFFLLLDPCSELLGGESLIARFLKGERREHLCLMAAGGLCGLYWEAWNSLSTAKWVYTLPVLNFWKIFEMPVLGYLGFLPFALEAAVMYNFMQALEDRVLTTPRRRRRAYLFQVAFWLLMFAALDAWTVISFSEQ
jgi:hypothetical protein